jgi:hypothetical protein
LFGASSGDAFQVDVGPAFNTVTTMAAGAMYAGITLTCSEFAEQVNFVVSKLPPSAASLA